MDGQNYREGDKAIHDNSIKSSNPNTEKDHSSLILKRGYTGPSDGLFKTTLNVNDHMTSNDKETEDYLNSFPPGYRFKPYDDELIYYYLERKIKDPSSLPPNKIKEVDLYKFNPEYLAANYESAGDNEWYFFTPRDRKYRNGERPNRAAGDGYWKATGGDKAIDRDGIKIGSKRSLVFYKGKPLKGDKTDWIMYEYGILNPPKRKKGGEDMRLDDVVLCRIHKKAEERSDPTRRRQRHVPPVVPDQVAAMQQTNPVPQNSNFQGPPTFPLGQPNLNPNSNLNPPYSLMSTYRPCNDQLIENHMLPYDDFDPSPLVPQGDFTENGLLPLPGFCFLNTPHNYYDPFPMNPNVGFGPGYYTSMLIPTPPTTHLPPSGGIEWPGQGGYQDPEGDDESQLLEAILCQPPPPLPYDHDHFPPDHPDGRYYPYK